MIRCSKCGTVNESDATFCRQCDAFLEWDGESLDDPAAPAAPPSAPHGTPPPPPSQPPATRPSAPPPAARPASPAPSPQPASRKPEKGKVTPERKAKVQEPTLVEPPKPGERVCPTCGTGNDPERKFCRRCGKAMDASVAGPAPASEPEQEPVRKRRGPGFLSRLGRQARQEASMAASNPQSLASAPSRLRMRGSFVVYGLLGAIGLGAVASYWYLPGVSDTVDGVVDEVMRTVQRMTGDRDEVVITRAQAQSEPGFPSLNLFDENIETWWAGEVSRNGRWQLDFEFQEPTDLYQVNIDSGAHEDAYAALGRPREFQIRANGKLGPVYTLKNSSDQQPIEIDVRDVKELRIVVNSHYVGQESDDVIAIREVAFVGPTG